ncbi:Iron-sulfur cluster carrier protein [subsurface metagenome]
MSVIAVTGLKGGTGKSTLTANLAYGLSALGHSVVVFDTDPQKSLWMWANLGKGFLSRTVRTLDMRHPERFKAAILESSASRVLIDTPPGFADPALAASLLADLVLLPCGPSPLDILAAKEALELTREAQKRRSGGKPIIRFVPSKTFPRTNLSRDLGASLESLGEKLLPAISHRVGIAEASIQGLTIGEYQPNSAAHTEFQNLAKTTERTIIRNEQGTS